jgi:hypothetical protein
MDTQSILNTILQIGVIAAAFAGSYRFYVWISDTKSEDVEALQHARILRRQAYQRALDELSAVDAEGFPILADLDTAYTFRPQETLMVLDEWSFDATLIHP